MEDTRIDAAPTPAHIFAYRAFRSVFVAEPESSPVRTSHIDLRNTNDNKENSLRSPTRGSRFTTSPLKNKRDAALVPEYVDLSLTPKRQRINPVSPTKSILKKANLPTPRRAELRDVTVTFKDVRMSVSPEMARRGSPKRVRSQPELRSTLAALSSVAVSKPAPENAPSLPLEVITKVDKQGKPSIFPAGVDLDAYVAQTEKEMRRLIRYGQNWREHARKQDDENAKLRILLKELQKENESLRQKGRPRDADIRLAGATNSLNPASRTVSETEPGKGKNQPSSLESRVRNTEPEKWKIPLDNPGGDRQPPFSIALPKGRAEEPHSEHAGTTRDTKKLSKRSPSETHRAEDVIEPSTTHGPYKVSAPPHRQDRGFLRSNSQSIPEPRDVGEGKQTPDMSKPISDPLSEGNRKAAARERLRLKREAKVGSMRASSAPVATNGTAGHDMLRFGDESQVDWMAMV